MSEEQNVQRLRPSIGGPAELPEGGGGGGGVIHRRPGGVGGPAELPVDLTATGNPLFHEVVRLRARLSSIEEQLLAAIAQRIGGVGGPAELPEGGEGGGGGFHPPHGEIAELQPFQGSATFRPPRGEIAELRPFEVSSAALEGRVAQLESRIADLEAQLGTQGGP